MIENPTFSELSEQVLFQPDISRKLQAVSVCREWLSHPDADFVLETPARPASDVQFAARPQLVDPRHLPRRSINTLEGRIALLHAVAHIEFTAIHLAWDMAYRFRGQPPEFYREWLGVAIEEAAHFNLVCNRLQVLGAAYGDLPAHRGLWELAEQTAGDLLHRLALIPRFMEARGLDVTPAMIVKLTHAGDQPSVEVLEVILREEIGHVALGTRWFHQVARQRGLEPEETYFLLIGAFIQGGIRGPFNKPARRQAGFSETELLRLDAL